MNILVLDIDNTLIKAKDIFIYKVVGKERIKMTTEDLAKNTFLNGKYDCSDFKDSKKVTDSILKGQIITEVTHFMRLKFKEGWEICLLTARCKKTKNLLKKIFRKILWVDEDNPKPIGKSLKKVFAVGSNVGIVSTIKEKVKVIKDLCKKYDNVIFIDDDQRYLDEMNKLNLSNLTTINTAEIIKNNS